MIIFYWLINEKPQVAVVIFILSFGVAESNGFYLHRKLYELSTLDKKVSQSFSHTYNDVNGWY